MNAILIIGGNGYSVYQIPSAILTVHIEVGLIKAWPYICQPGTILREINFPDELVKIALKGARKNRNINERKQEFYKLI